MTSKADNEDWLKNLPNTINEHRKKYHSGTCPDCGSKSKWYTDNVCKPLCKKGGKGV